VTDGQVGGVEKSREGEKPRRPERDGQQPTGSLGFVNDIRTTPL
jgi:hypothetical protein